MGKEQNIIFVTIQLHIGDKGGGGGGLGHLKVVFWSYSGVPGTSIAVATTHFLDYYFVSEWERWSASDTYRVNALIYENPHRRAG